MTSRPSRHQKSAVSALALATSLWALAPLAHAGRPLTVDDANTNDPGNGHIEAWYAQPGDGAKVWTIAPAYGIAEGVEIGAALARETESKTNASALQVKFRLTESKKDGCNFGATLGVAHSSAASGTDPYVNGLFTCNMEHVHAAVHLNLGAIKPSDGATLRTWGVAFEHELGGEAAAHIEYFGQEQSKPTLQFGLRKEVVKNFQIDGTVGRSNKDTVFSLGMKFMF